MLNSDSCLKCSSSEQKRESEADRHEKKDDLGVGVRGGWEYAIEEKVRFLTKQFQKINNSLEITFRVLMKVT